MPSPLLLCPQPPERWRGACCGTQQLVQTGQGCRKRCRGCHMPSPPLLCPQPPKRWRGPCCGTQQLVQTGQVCSMRCRGCHMHSPPLLCPQPPERWRGPCYETQQLVPIGQVSRMRCRATLHKEKSPLHTTAEKLSKKASTKLKSSKKERTHVGLWRFETTTETNLKTGNLCVRFPKEGDILIINFNLLYWLRGHGERTLSWYITQ